MARVPQYQPDQVTSQVVRGPRASGQALNFNPIAQGLNQVAASAININDRITTTAAEEALVGFERDKNKLFFAPESGYFNTQGRNAYDAAGLTNKELEKLKNQYADGLDSDARAKFEKVAGVHITKAQADIAKHSSDGLRVWEVSTINAQVENTMENGALYWNDPKNLKMQQHLGEQSIHDAAELSGESAQATNEKLESYRSKFYKGSISTATNQSSADGEKLLEQYGDFLEPQDKVNIENLIDKKKKAEETESIAGEATLAANRVVGNYDTRQEIIDEVNKIEDPKVQKAAMSEAMYRFNQKKTAQDEERVSSFNDASKFVSDPSAGGLEVWKAQNPEAWNNLNAKEQAQLEKGAPVVSDMVLFSNLTLLPKEELAKINPADYDTQLADGELTKLISAVKTARGLSTDKEKIDSQAGRTRTTQTKSAVDQIFGKKPKGKSRSKAWNEKVNAFYSALDSEVNYREDAKGSKLTSEEYTNVLSGFTREVVEEGLIFDSTLTIEDIPAENMGELTEYLRSNNIPVTSDNLIKVYQQASE